jgi:hypothetical protein
MKKSHREICRVASREGMAHPRIEQTGCHPVLIGEVNGQTVEVVVTGTKAFATDRTQQCTKLNIRRAIRAAEGTENGGDPLR